jgi:hypothetical protein
MRAKSRAPFVKRFAQNPRLFRYSRKPLAGFDTPQQR